MNRYFYINVGARTDMHATIDARTGLHMNTYLNK